MLSPQEIIGQKVWVTAPPDPHYPDLQPAKIKAELTQPTSPPWFFALYIDPPRSIATAGQWISLYEAQLAVLQDPVLELEAEYEDELNFS